MSSPIITDEQLAEAARKVAPKISARPVNPPFKKKEPEPTEDKPKEPEEDDEKEPQEKPEHAYAFARPEVSMSMEQFQTMLSTILVEARKPVTDERAVARIKRMKEHNQMLQKDQRQMLIQRFRSCNHMQLPGSVMTGCSCVAWATQSDGKKRGTCQHCGTVFSSERKECLSDEIYDAYQLLIRMPTHPAGNVNSIFTSA